MKFKLFDIILASWLLILVESFNNFPRQVVIRDELSNQPFIPGFRDYSSNDGFYQVVRHYPENSEHSERPENSEHSERPENSEHSERPEYPKQSEHHEHHKKRTCSNLENAVKESTRFCKNVMKGLEELKEGLHGCQEVETPIGTYCAKDQKCYTLSSIYSDPATPLTLYEVYQKACPCPQKHFSFGDIPKIPANAEDFLECFGQKSTTTNVVVLSVDPTSDKCTYIHYDSSEVGEIITTPVTCTPTTTNNLIIPCQVSCEAGKLPDPTPSPVPTLIV